MKVDPTSLRIKIAVHVCVKNQRHTDKTVQGSKFDDSVNLRAGLVVTPSILEEVVWGNYTIYSH